MFIKPRLTKKKSNLPCVYNQSTNHKKNHTQVWSAGVAVQGDVTEMLTKFWYHIPFVRR